MRWLRKVRVARRTWVFLDAAIALVLSATSVVAVAVGDRSFGAEGPLAFVLAASCGLPIAVRRRWPTVVATLTMVTTAACVWAAAPHQSALQPFVALTLAFYSLGSLSRLRRGVVALVVLGAMAGVLLLAAVALGHAQIGDAVPNWLWLFATWGVGRIVNAGRQRNRELAQANQMLAAHQELQTQAALAVERGRIARELHDIVAHKISLMVVQAGAAERILADREPQVGASLTTIASTGREAVDDMRRMLGMLRTIDSPEDLERQPGLADLDKLLVGFRRAGLAVDFTARGEAPEMSSGLDLAAYRIIQEGLTNALKHGGPCRVSVCLHFSSEHVEIKVDDDGTPHAVLRGTGLGLVGMRERAALYGGTVHAGPRPQGSGYTVRAVLPLAGRAST